MPRRLATVASLLWCIALLLPARAAHGQGAATPGRDGAHDFDFELGTWDTKLSLRLRPLTGSDEWVEYTGVTTVRPVWNGAANLVELVADGKPGHFEGASLRLYNPTTRRWTLNFSNRRSGTLTTPMIGDFSSGKGIFYDQEDLDGKPIFVRFVITKETADRIRFEQAYSEDGGAHWEVNWIAVDTRRPGQ